ncbi:MAG: SIR2 family protein [Bacteroidetes bacterium]|uniref:SIR2 family protein n=1 Tax=Phnomibacter sp. TaxID=2836217 RepID=UPI002FDDB4B0|nr:SIR2 family protein [Bacteroidota bacterium]
MAITFLLGAGFSMEANYPSAHALNEKFFTNVENKLLKFSSGEWMWDEYDEVTSHNGKLNTDYLNVSYLHSELIDVFQKTTFQPFDYEVYYDWIFQNDFSISIIKECCQRVNQRLKKTYKSISDDFLFSDPGVNELNKIRESYVYLIADLLRRPYDREINSNHYNAFINCISGIESNIFTLNHDTLLEHLFAKNNIKYSDGFSSNESILVNVEKNPLTVFTNSFEEKTRLHKLHGSIDYYRFQELSQSNGVYYDTSNYWFFKPSTYWEKHIVSKIDPTNQKIIQSLNPDIKPQFLTGKSKSEKMSNHLIYKNLYTRFKNSLRSTEKLIIIGYSFRDNHINELLIHFLSVNTCPIVNINPYVSFPFRRNYSKLNITELKSIRSL